MSKRGVRFVFADSKAMRFRWLQKATRDRPGVSWTVVVFHHPVYSPGDHGPTPGFRPRLPRLFRRNGVDLVLIGHDHLYAVTTPRGRIRYVVTGGAGASLHDCERPRFSGVCRSRHHFLYVVVRRHLIRFRAVGPRGVVFHRFKTAGRP